MPQARLAFFTDGSYELATPSGERLDMDRFSKMLGRIGEGPISAARERIVLELNEARGNEALADDIAIVLVGLD